MCSPDSRRSCSFLVAAVFLSSLFYHSGLLAAEPWTAHMGSHYRERAWAESVRDPGGVGIFARSGDPRQGATLRSVVSQAQKDVILNAGGLGSGRNQQLVSDFMSRMTADGGRGWKSELRDKIGAANGAISGDGRVAWQFGNEINSRRFNQTLRSWKNDDVRPTGHDRSIIPLYVEYYLAPGVEALRSSPTEGRRAPQVVLGSVASYANPSAQRFMDELLRYQVQGTFAPSLKGKKVYEFVNVLAVHYVTTANRGDWRAALGQLHQRWMGKGAVSAIWSTEELGVRRARADAGAVTSLLVLARYLGWWFEWGMDSSAGKAFLWGSDVGSAGRRGDDAMDFLLNEIGNTALIPARQVTVNGENLEVHEYGVAGSRDKMLFIFPRDQKSGAVISQLQLNSVAGGNLKGHFFSSEKTSTVELQYDRNRGLLKSFHLPPVSALVVKVEG